MRMPTEFVYEAVSFDWEALIPILFFLLYGIAQFFGSKKDAAPPDEEAAPDEVDPLERARQIREEIQRKMEGRRKESAEKGAASTAPRPEPPAPSPVPAGQGAEGSYRAQRSSSSQGPSSANAPSTELSIEERLRRQQARLEESRKRQTEARKKARDIEKKAGVHARRTKASKPVDAYRHVVPPSVLRSELMKGLRDPNSLRKAVLYREILDAPVGLRSRSSPGLFS